jgi:proline iminopeptidase
VTRVTHAPGRLYDVGGHHLWVETEGSGPPVVLLGGVDPAGSHTVFHPHFSKLAIDHEVHYLDLYGRGRSDRPADLREITFAQDVEDAATVIADLDVGPVHLYGFSYGGLLGQALALDYPGLLRSLTLANTLHSPLMWQRSHANINREIANQLPEIWRRIEELHAAGVPSTDSSLAVLFGQAARVVRFYNPANAALLAAEPGARNADLYSHFVGDDVDFLVSGQIPAIPDFRPRLPEIRVPVMVLAGRHDRALHPALQREFVAADPRIALHVLERSGSFCHVEEPDAVHTLLRALIASATPH